MRFQSGADLRNAVAESRGDLRALFRNCLHPGISAGVALFKATVVQPVLR